MMGGSQCFEHFTINTTLPGVRRLAFLFLSFFFLFFSFFFFFFFFFLGPHPQHMESYSCQPTPQLMQRRILNPLSEAKDPTRNLMVPSWIHFRGATMGTPRRLAFLCGGR